MRWMMAGLERWAASPLVLGSTATGNVGAVLVGALLLAAGDLAAQALAQSGRQAHRPWGRLRA